MVPRDIFPKLKSNIKLAIRQDGDGNEVEVEVRENEEQLVKFQEIVDLLVAAGYFRARIKGLSPFDKVVGGMTWCIESCNVDVDVDLLFQENSTIGQKIALTEKIVAVLPKMKCPYGIEPHQIQGLDFIHIFPVIQWLVKTSLQFRQETFKFVRKNAINQFNKVFTLNEEITADNMCNKICNNVKCVRETYRPKRQYRLKHTPPKDEFNRVQVTLLEYGLKEAPIVLSLSKDETKSSLDHSLETQTEEQHVNNLMKSLTLMDVEDEQETSLTVEEKIKLQKHYAMLQAELQDGGIQSREERQLAKMEIQKATLKNRIEKLKVKKIDTEKNINEYNKSIENTLSIKNEAIGKLNQIIDSSKDKNSEISELEQLLIVNENLREQEIQFKEQCRNELDHLQQLIEESKANINKKIVPTEIQKRLNLVRDKVQKVRLILAKTNQQISVHQRKLDDIPTRAELAQYQQRFLELYNQVAAKHKETKQYFTLYNTLNDMKMYISKELSLLNSIFDNYPQAMSSNVGKEDFLKELTNIVESIKETKAKVENRFKDEQKRRDNLNIELQALITDRRKYITLVRQMSIECKRNELLSAELKHS